jgi:hypothetical protein
MSQRESGYQRKLLDQYETPAGVMRALIPHLPEFNGKIWEPACGSGKMVAAIRQAGFDVVGSDITQGVDSWVRYRRRESTRSSPIHPMLWRKSSSNAPCTLTILA